MKTLAAVNASSRRPATGGAAAIRTPQLRRPAPALRPDGKPAVRWPWGGLVLGALIALCVWAPASWLAEAVNTASAGRLVLADAQGTVWQGNAVVIFTGGAGSQDARALPGRLQWRLRPTLTGGAGLHLGLQQACCLNQTVALVLHAGWRSALVDVQPAVAAGTALGQWPAALLTGLGTPWNTLQPGGALRLSSQNLGLQWAAGRFSLRGQATLDLLDFSSRLSTLPRLGSYRMQLSADEAQPGTARVSLSTLDGALRLGAEGSWSASGLRLRGEASAAPEDEAALNNLLNIIGRRNGARSIISIG